MNYKMMGRFIGHILLVEAVFMSTALIISLVLKEINACRGFATAIGIILVITAVLLLLCRGNKTNLKAKDGFVCVGIGWIIMSILGALPFYISREIPHYIDALFETVSGFTTTGSSILSDVESLSRGLLYWRSFLHWIGGMGVLVFVLAIGAGSGKNNGFTMHILRAESPGPKVGKLVPKMKQTAEILYMMYILMTILNIIFLLIGKMPLFDAVCTAFGTAGTGGFGIKNDSMASYSPYIQNVTAVFMLLFGVNFSCYYMLLIRQFGSVIRDEEFRFYAGVVVISILLIVFNIQGTYGTLEETIRHVIFQVASIVTTTGFATTDFDMWPGFSKAIILGLLMLGACAGSTAGGFKCGRFLLVFKSLKRNVKQILHPQKVQVIKVNGQMVEEKVIDNTNAYLSAYVLMVVVSFLLVSIDRFSTTSAFTAVLTCVNNVGPGLEAVGPTCNFSQFSDFSKLVLIMDMLAGRLEIFPILVLFSRSTWSRK